MTYRSAARSCEKLSGIAQRETSVSGRSDAALPAKGLQLIRLALQLLLVLEDVHDQTQS
jgi:hypothetical protein